MSDTIDLRLPIPIAMKASLHGLTASEAGKALSKTGEKLVEREKLFLKHQQDGQKNWEEPTRKYAEWKKKKYGTTEKFVLTGKAKKELTRVGKIMRVTANGKKRDLKIVLRGGGSHKGKSAYQIAQRGRFAGVTATTKNWLGRERKTKFSAEDTRQRNVLVQLGKLGIKPTRQQRRDYLFGKKPTFERRSIKPMPITAVRDGDNTIAYKVLEEELNITMKIRGLV